MSIPFIISSFVRASSAFLFILPFSPLKLPFGRRLFRMRADPGN